MSRTVRIVSILILSMILAVAFVPASFADSNKTDESIQVNFTTAAKIEYKIDFPFSDKFFTVDDSSYSHDLAKASMGLTVASFRLEQKTDAGNYLKKAGFEGIDLSAYETLPTTDSIANCMAYKRIGNFTLIAVGVCGYNYSKEWASNFKIGDEERAEGFNEAAQIVNGRIRDYIKENNLSGDLRLWVTGMSRAGAVSNIVAADMTDSGLFTKVYGYTFGTPRTTRKPGSYKNIFNIMSKDDIVPKVPLADWGYEHFGVDLYLPSQECDSDWPSKAKKAADELDCINFRNNPELYDQFRDIFTYIYELMPTSADYENGLQESLISIISMNDDDNVITILQKAVRKIEPKTDEQATELASLLSYLDTMSAKYLLYGNMKQKEEGRWLEGEGAGSNLMVEHTVTTYIPWLLSTDSADELYSNKREFIHLMLNTNSTVNVVGLDGTIQFIDESGKKHYLGKTYDDTYLAMYRTDSQVFVDIPLDAPYSVVVKPSERENVTMMALKYSIDSVEPETLAAATYSVEADDAFVVYSEGGNHGIKIDSGSSILINGKTSGITMPMSRITRIENSNILNLSLVSLLKIVVVILAILLLELILTVIVSIVRRIMKKERTGRGREFLFMNNVLFLALAEIIVWYFAPAVRFLNEGIALLTFAFIGVYATRSKKRLPVVILILMMAIILLTQYGYIGEVTLNGAAVILLRDLTFALVAIALNRKAGVFRNPDKVELE